MDALDVLKSDHEKVHSLFEQIKSGDSSAKSQLFHQIRDELLVHTQIEEGVFYPAFKNYPEFQGILADSYTDHREVKSLLKQMDEQNFMTKIDELRFKVEAHVNEEENELFPMVRKLMKRAEREVLGRHLIAAKEDQAAAA